MNAEKQFHEIPSRVIQNRKEGETGWRLTDCRPEATVQAKMLEAIQRQEEDEEPLQGKLSVQLQEEEEEPLQGRFAVQRQEDDESIQGKFEGIQQQTDNHTGMPDTVKQRMENAFGTDFSAVRVHPDSSKAPEVGALAYTQGTDIHFAPGQFKPDTSAGQQLLGHELTHVVQQAEGRVQPTTEISGMAVNDDVTLEHEADVRGAKAANL